MNARVIVEKSPAALIELAAQQIVEIARESIAARGSFSIVLAGGSTPRALYELLASDQYQSRIDWRSTHVFFGDERAVAPEDELSNYHMAQAALLSNVPIPSQNVHRMEAEREDLESAARDYAEALKSHQPLDLVLLGMGDDGHTASLFPQSPVVSESTLLCAATPVASLQPHVRRLTLTFPAINAARHIWIIVTGTSKASRLQNVFADARDVETTPVAGVEPYDGELTWFLDEAAAAMIKRQ